VRYLRVDKRLLVSHISRKESGPEITSPAPLVWRKPLVCKNPVGILGAHALCAAPAKRASPQKILHDADGEGCRKRSGPPAKHRMFRSRTNQKMPEN
jgi:hypothetical protein